MTLVSLRVATVAIAALALPSVAVATTSAHPTTAPAWRRVATLPLANEGMTAARLADGSIVAVGGSAVSTHLNRMATRFVPATGSWQQLADAPVALDTPAVLALSLHAVMVVAPSFASGNIAVPSKALLLDPIQGTWLRLPSVPVALLSPRLAQLDAHTILAVGGVGETIGAIFDRTTQHWTVLRSPVAHLASYTLAQLSDGRAMLLASVSIDAANHPLAVRRAFVLDAAHSWHEVARPPVAVDGAQAATLDAHRILFAGGYPVSDDPRQAAPSALIYDTAANRWSIAGSSGATTRGAQVLSLGNGQAMLIGGHGADGAPSAGCLLFNGKSWQSAQSLPGSWSSYATVGLATGDLMVIGGDRSVGTSFTAVADTMVLPLAVTPVG